MPAGGWNTLVSGEAARNAMEVMLAAEMSIAEGRKIDLPLR